MQRPQEKGTKMLFGCLPIQNIPVLVFLALPLILATSFMLDELRENRHARGIARVRRSEVHRKAMAAMAYGKAHR